MTARKNDPETIREEGANVLLAQLLRDRGVSARAERRSRKGAPDIRVELRSGDRIILECKWEGSAGLLESQLDERLNDFPEAVGLMGVLYPGRIRDAEDTQVRAPGCHGPPMVASRLSRHSDATAARSERVRC